MVNDPVLSILRSAMRATIAIACGLLFIVGCTKKVELPTASSEAPKNVIGVGTGSGKTGGLPQPPEKPQ